MFTYESPRQTLEKALVLIVVLIMGVVMGYCLSDLLRLPIPVQMTPVPAPSWKVITMVMEVVG